MKETRKLYSVHLRNLCIEKNWYTKGTNEQYSNLLSFADDKENVTTLDIVRIAEDIKENSITDYPVSSICFEIAEICHSFFE